MEAFQWVLHYPPLPPSPCSSPVRTKFTQSSSVSNRLCFHRCDLEVAPSSQILLMVLEKHGHVCYTVYIHKLKVYLHCLLIINSQILLWVQPWQQLTQEAMSPSSGSKLRCRKRDGSDATIPRHGCTCIAKCCLGMMDWIFSLEIPAVI